MKLRRYADIADFVASLRLHHAVGLHAAILLAAAALAGLLVSKLLLMAGLEVPWLRFPIAVVAAYGLFLLMVQWWLSFIGLHRDAALPEGIDLVPLPDGAGGGEACAAASKPFATGGGTFDGGGASGGWDGSGKATEWKTSAASAKGELAIRGKGGAAYAGLEAKAQGVASGAEAGASAALGEAGASAALGEAGGLLAGLAELAWPLVILAAVVAAFLAASGWFVTLGPVLLVETAVEVAIASGLIRSVARRRDGEWLSSLFSRTAWKATGLAIGAVLFGVAVRMVDPAADTLGQAIVAVLR